MLWMVGVDGPNVLEELPVGLVGEALDQPVDRRVEQALILFIGQLVVPILHDVVVQLKHVLNHEQEVVFVHRIDGVADSGQVSACVRCAQRLRDAPDHFR